MYWSDTIFFQNCYVGEGLSDQGPFGCGGGSKDLIQSVDWTPCNDVDIIEKQKPDNKNFSYKIYIHKLIIRNAAAKLDICSTAIDLLEQGIEDTDWKTYFGLEFGTSIFHFDALSNYNAIEQNWNLISVGLKKQQFKSDFYKLGFLTHAFQDFYAHSNYSTLLIKYYKNDKNHIPFSEVLEDKSGKYEGLKVLLRKELKTGSFDLITYTLRKIGATIQGIKYEDTHNYIADDEVETFAGNYAARLAELETHKILQQTNKCN